MLHCTDGKLRTSDCQKNIKKETHNLSSTLQSQVRMRNYHNCTTLPYLALSCNTTLRALSDAISAQ
jgi:hypothetical protein